MVFYLCVLNGIVGKNVDAVLIKIDDGPTRDLFRIRTSFLEYFLESSDSKKFRILCNRVQ